MMTVAAVQWSEEEQGGLLRWILPASIALHVVTFAWLPSTHHSPPKLPPPPLVLEVADVPPPAPAPAPPTPEPTAEPTPEAAPPRAASRAPAAPANVARGAREAAPASAPASEAPMDFTSTVFSNDGPGLAVGGGGASLSSTAPAPAAASLPLRRAPVAPAPPRLVPPSSLARRPRAPGLDTELERQYPAEARRSGISGSAVLRVRILSDGRIGEVRIMSESWTGFGPACERTVRAARWEPPIDRDGAPVATEITYTCRFEVRS